MCFILYLNASMYIQLIKNKEENAHLHEHAAFSPSYILIKSPHLS